MNLRLVVAALVLVSVAGCGGAEAPPPSKIKVDNTVVPPPAGTPEPVEAPPMPQQAPGKPAGVTQ